MKSFLLALAVAASTMAGCTLAAEPDLGSSDATKRKAAIEAEIRRRKRTIRISMEGLAREFKKKYADRNHERIRDLLRLLKEFRASEAVGLLCQNIEYVDPKYPIAGGSMQPRELSYPVTAVLESIGNPARKDLIKRLGKAKWASGKVVLLTTLVNIMGENAVRAEIEKGSLRKAKEAKELKRLLDLMHPTAPVSPVRK